MKSKFHMAYGIANILRTRAYFPVTVIKTALKRVGDASPE